MSQVSTRRPVQLSAPVGRHRRMLIAATATVLLSAGLTVAVATERADAAQTPAGAGLDQQR